MSISSEITRITKNISDSLDAVEAKGVVVPSGSNSDDLPGLIAQITGGGSSGIVISDTPDPAGGTVRTITAVEISGTKQITENGTGIDVAEYAAVDVAVPSGDSVFAINLTLNTSTQMWEPDKTFAQIQDAHNAGKTLVTYAGTQYDPFQTSCIWNDGDGYADPIFWYTVSWFDYYEVVNGLKNDDICQLDITGLVLFDRMEYQSPLNLVEKAITANGTYDPILTDYADGYSLVTVNVPSGTPSLQSKTNIDPSTSSQTITPDNGFDGLSSVQINAMPSGTEGTPTATKGTVSNNAIAITPSVTNAAGYISGGTHSGTSVSVSASELVGGTKSITSSGTTDVTNYANASVAAGSVTAPSTISGTSATVSTGTNTLTLTKTVSVTPNVTTAGYISSGTAGNSSISLQASVTTKAAATIHPSTSDQTIASGTYTTGAQTIKAVTTTNLTAANIKSGVVVQIGDSTDSDCVTSVTGTYTGGSSKALYKYEGLASRTANSYGATNAKVTVTKAGTYNICYVAIRGSSSGTMGTNLYIGGTGKGNQQTWDNGTYGQYVSYTNQSIAANTDVTIYATSGSNSRKIYVGQLIVEEV